MLLLILASCTAGGTRQGDSPVPCETVVVVWGYVDCPGGGIGGPFGAWRGRSAP